MQHTTAATSTTASSTTVSFATATSRDGTRITYRSSGDGPPLILVHGAFNTSDDFSALSEHLVRDYRVVVFDRRGYGDTPLGPQPGDFSQDGEDIAAVIAALGQPAYLFGHSAGALAALHGARAAGRRLRRLALYEPAGAADHALLHRFQQLRSQRNDATAVAAFITAGGGPPEAVMAAQLNQPTWAPRLRLVGGVERDLTAQVGYTTQLPDWRDITIPVQVLTGSESPHVPFHQRAKQLAHALPDAQLAELPRQGHLAHTQAPALIAETLHSFLTL